MKDSLSGLGVYVLHIPISNCLLLENALNSFVESFLTRLPEWSCLHSCSDVYILSKMRHTLTSHWLNAFQCDFSLVFLDLVCGTNRTSDGKFVDLDDLGSVQILR
jgi:hypothetical protein